jgi:glycosyltransferase involved in cell wall biosynthesis
MRFSVLLPTRNGGPFIENCIRSILEQDHGGFELVISDNANTDATPDVLRRFADDPRVRILRQDRVLPVAENWSATLNAASGEYILMMGDDDYLLPGSLTRLDRALEQHGNPSCVLFNGYSYVAPNSISGSETGYWSPSHFNFGPDFASEAIMNREQRMSIVSDMFRFQQRIPLNMQTALFSRKTAMAVRDGAFQAPFPDHYLLAVMLIDADAWLYLPERLVIVGVSPKSFGHYFYSQSSSDGLAYLGIDTKFPGSLPANELLNGMYQWLLRLKQSHAASLRGTSIDHPAYVVRQVYFWLIQARYRHIGGRDLLCRLKLLSLADWLAFIRGAIRPEYAFRLLGRLRIRRKTQTQALWHNLLTLAGPKDIREFAQWLDRKPDSPA